MITFFLNGFPVCRNLFVLLFLVTSCLVVAVQPYMEWIAIKKNSQGIASISIIRMNVSVLLNTYLDFEVIFSS